MGRRSRSLLPTRVYSFSQEFVVSIVALPEEKEGLFFCFYITFMTASPGYFENYRIASPWRHCTSNPKEREKDLFHGFLFHHPPTIYPQDIHEDIHIYCVLFEINTIYSAKVSGKESPLLISSNRNHERFRRGSLRKETISELQKTMRPS